MYILIKARLASMWELKNCYTLDEALKLYALYRMEQDVEAGRVEDKLTELTGQRRSSWWITALKSATPTFP